MREITHITVHHSGTEAAKTTVASMRRYHMEEKGWVDLAYHLVIDDKGDVVEGRSVELHPDTHSEDFDPTGHLFVCVVGNFEEEYVAPSQLLALNSVLATLQWQFPDARLGSHLEYAKTLCPGRHLYAHLPRRTP